jgi:hypothetical protein
MSIHGDQIDLLSAGDVYNLVCHRPGNGYLEKPICQLSVMVLGYRLEIVQGVGAVRLLLLATKDDVLA